MVYLEGLIGAVNDDTLRESLTERLDIVRHKIKFMDTVPLICYDSGNHANVLFYEHFVAAGGDLQTGMDGVVYIIYHEQGIGLNALMGAVPASLDANWQPVQNNRVIFLDQDAYPLDSAESHIELIEDLAEMIHPGSFIFGHEGDKWIRFSV